MVTFIEVSDDDDLPSVTAPPRHAGGRPRTSTKPKTVANRRHVQAHDDRKNGREAVIVEPDPDVPTDDLATLVVRKTMRRLAGGGMQPTLRDGLQAQQLLDRRAEKAADRSFMLNLARALAGGGTVVPPTLLPPGPESSDDIIEGSFTEENLAPAHLREG